MKKAIESIKESNQRSSQGSLADIKNAGMSLGGAILIEEKKLEKFLENDTKILNKTLKDELGEQLKEINETLKGLKDGFTGSPSKSKPDTAPNLGASKELGKREVPTTFKEQLMSTVGGIKARSQATKEFLSSPIKNIKEAVGGFAANVQSKVYKGMEDIGDIISAPAGYNPEKEQFAKDFGLRSEEGRARDQKFRDEMKQRIEEGGYDDKEKARRLKEADEYVSDETLAEGRKRYEQTKGAQQDLAEARAPIEAARARGFEATEPEQQRLSIAEQNLAAVDPRVKQAEQNLKEANEQNSRAAEKENDDNIFSSEESMAKSMEENNVIVRDLLETTKQQLDVVNRISESISPKEPVDIDLQNLPVTKKLDELITVVKEKEFTAAGGGGSLLDSAKDLLGDRGKAGGGAAGKTAGRFSKLATIGKVGGAALAVAGGAYAAYSGFSEASDEQKAQLADIEAKKKSGELTADQAAAMTKQVNEQATEKKGGAIGQGTGIAAGGIAGMKLGAALGSFAGPVGTVVGGVAGGALGAFAGSSLGKKAGELGGSVVNWFKGEEKQEIVPQETAPAAAAAAALPASATKDNTKNPKLSASDMREAERYARESSLSTTEAKGKGVSVTPANRPPSELGKLSLEYNDQTRAAAQTKPTPAPIIMNNNTSTGTTQISPMKATPRNNSGSYLDKHLEKSAVY
jgi:hypothetical protein